MPENENNRILCIAAHPDDLDFGAAGTVAKWVKEGYDVSYLIATKGDAGGSDRTVLRDEMATIRVREQTAAAAAVGVNNISFLDFKDGNVVAGQDLRFQISKVIREIRPFRVLGPSPEISWMRIAASHPDHLAVGQATLFSVYPDSRNPFAFPSLLEDGLEPHIVSELWLMASPHAFLGPISNNGVPNSEINASMSNGIYPNVAKGNNGTKVTSVDITDTFDLKIKALSKHVSQLSDIEIVREFIKEFLSHNAKLYGAPEGTLAEAFQVVTEL